MNHLDLFSGIGGFALAAQWMGWNTKAFCEKDPYCQKVLKKNFKDIPIHEDITTIPRIGGIDIITGGFPCQPFSVAGKQKSKTDNRYLWPSMLEVIKREKPAWVVGENVAGIVNLALDQVLTDLEAEDYATQSFVIPACAVNAPHRRDRVWIIAHAKSTGTGVDEQGIRRLPEPCSEGEERMGQEDSRALSNSKGLHDRWLESRKSKRQIQESGISAESADVAHSNCEQRERCIKGPRHGQSNLQRELGRGCKDGAKQWAAEPSVGRVVNGLSRRLDRIRGLGNAVVPQVVYEIYKAILAI